MALLRRSGSRFTTNIWPGFVDAMTALLLVLMFVLSIFMIIQSVFREKISGQETELSRLENEVMNLIADLSLQKEEYKNLNAMNIAINKSLKEQKVLNESKSLELNSALKNLDLANRLFPGAPSEIMIPSTPGEELAAFAEQAFEPQEAAQQRGIQERNDLSYLFSSIDQFDRMIGG